MPKITPDQRRHLVEKTVALILELRQMYLAAGASPLRHWDQIHDRMRAATRTCASVEEWATRMLRDLQLGAPRSSLSTSIDQVSIAVREVGDRAWLDLLDREHGYVIARSRLAADARRHERETEREVEQQAEEALRLLAKGARP